LLQRRERPIGQELPAEALVEALDLAGGGGRSDRGVTMGDAVLPADPVEHDFHRLGPEPSGEALAVVGQDLVGNPVATKRPHQHLTHGLGGRPAHQTRGHAEAAVVVHPGDHLQLGVVV
jgi:hypothetical protein